MADILALPAWFNPWGWTALAVVAIIILIVIIVLIARSGKKDKRAAKAKGNTPARGESVKEERREERVAEQKAKEPAAVKEEPKPEAKPAQKAEVKSAQKTESKPKPAPKSEAKPAQKAAAKPKEAEPAKTYHIAKRKEDGRWQVKAAGASKAIKLFLTQQDAIEFAKKTAENQDARIVIHKEDGTFRRLSYTKK